MTDTEQLLDARYIALLEDNARLRALLEECRPYITTASHWDAALIASVDTALKPKP